MEIRLALYCSHVHCPPFWNSPSSWTTKHCVINLSCHPQRILSLLTCPFHYHPRARPLPKRTSPILWRILAYVLLLFCVPGLCPLKQAMFYTTFCELELESTFQEKRRRRTDIFIYSSAQCPYLYSALVLCMLIKFKFFPHFFFELEITSDR